MKKVLSLILIALIGIPTWYFTTATNDQKAVVKEAFKWILSKAKPSESTSVSISDGSYASAHFFGGMPVDKSYPGSIKILENEGFVVGYCERRKNPAWVCYRIFRDAIEKGPKRPSRFSVDDRTKARVSHDDYTRSGYDRGHMAPNWAIALRYGEEAQKQTFLMSNIVPQKPNLNQGPWRELEEDVAKWYGNEFEEVWVMTGPVYDDEVTKLESGVEIPDAFFKIIVDQKDDGSVRVMSVLMEQTIVRRANWEDYLVSVDVIEEVTGLDFLPGLESETEALLEKKTSSF